MFRSGKTKTVVTGFASVANRAYLTRGGGHYIHAEKLRHTNPRPPPRWPAPDRYHSVADNLRVKEVHVAPGDGEAGARTQRLVVCHNPKAAERDRQVRANLVAHLQQSIDGSPAGLCDAATSWSAPCAPSPGCAATCAARRQGAGLLRVDHAAIKPEQPWTASGCCAPPTSPSPPTSSPPVPDTSRLRDRRLPPDPHRRCRARRATPGTSEAGPAPSPRPSEIRPVTPHLRECANSGEDQLMIALQNCRAAPNAHPPTITAVGGCG